MIYPRGKDVQLSTDFHLREYECHCGKCEQTLVNLSHVEKLQKLRDIIQKPILITSAYRCPAHNKAVGGASRSQHMDGCATDIMVGGLSIKKLATLCKDFDGLGIYNGFIHIDSRGYRARWDYTT